MVKAYFAHSENDHGKKHSLKDHLACTADIAESFAYEKKLAKILRVAGLLHDFGKYQLDFQTYLIEGGRRGSVPHAAWGAGYARILRQLEISLAVDGHHKGIPGRAKWQIDTDEFYRNTDLDFSIIRDAFLKDNNLEENDLKPQLPEFLTVFDRDLFIRFLFSALTDADWLDTEAHFNPEYAHARRRKELPIDAMIENLDIAIAQKSKIGEINNLRNQVREEAIRKSEGQPGFYSLSLPTGMGKTLVSIAWALKHAKANSLRRIIVVLPFINIIDQTAKILKELFGEELILEHHSGFNENAKNDELAIDKKEKQLACENWDYPVIVTTTVQFFESLFSNRPSRCRRIHNLAESIVIFDEVQSLPKDIILPSLTMLQNIQKFMNVSFLFCTATMPAFEKREGFEGIEQIEPLIAKPEIIFSKTRRVDYTLYQNLQPVSYDVLTEEIEKQNGSVLCIFNTKKAAKILYEHAIKTKSNWDNIYHLSTGMCPVHRKKSVSDIISDLASNQKIFVASTQLIEAGVDFDFPCVFREIAPLESIIQSAGRCNREGKMPINGKVFLFSLLDSGMPDKMYKTYAEFAIDLIKDNLEQLYQFDFYKEYYRKIIRLFTNPDRFDINESRKNLEFETVNDSYRLIRNPTESLFIYQYDDASYRLYNEIKAKPFLTRDDYRELQIYSVQVYKNFLINNAQLYSELRQGLLIWNGTYDKKTGISTQLLSPDECVV